MVHFPIVLILLTVPFQAVVVWKNWQQIRWTTLCLMAAAFISSLMVSTVFHALITPEAPQDILAIYTQHETFARYTLWMSGFTLVLKAIGDLYKVKRRSYDIVVLIAAIVTSVLLSVTGHHGAKLVHVAGAGPMGKYLMEHAHSGKDTHADGMETKDHHRDDSTGMEDHHSEDTTGMDMDGGKTHSENEMGNDHHGDGTTHDMDMKGMDKSKDMKDHDMNGKDKTKDIKDHDMNAMDKTNDMKGHDMKEMKNDSMKGMDMNHTNMPGMNMPGMNMKNPLDTFKFEDNNPARKKSKPRSE